MLESATTLNHHSVCQTIRELYTLCFGKQAKTMAYDNELRNGAFCFAKCVILQAKTRHIAVRNMSVQNANLTHTENQVAEAVFNCIFASIREFGIRNALE